MSLQIFMTSDLEISDVTMEDDVPYAAVLNPLYAVTNTFLGSVLQPNTLPQLRQELNIDFTQPADIINSIPDQWQGWAK